SGKSFRTKSHRPLQLVIAFQHVRDPFALAKILPTDKSLEPRPVAKDRHREITPMQEPQGQRLLAAFRDVASANRHIEGAVVAVQPGKTPRHFDERSEIV